MTKKVGWLLVALLLLSPTSKLYAQPKNGIVGYWKTIDDKSGQLKSVVKLWVQDGKMVGRIIRTFPRPDQDQNPNKTCGKCEGKLKGQVIRGMTFLWGFKPDPDNPNKWVEGEIVDPESGKQYHCQLELIDGGKKLEVFGYIRLLFKVGRTQTWQRGTEKDADPSGPKPSIN
jgi:hypothetical protein